MAGVRSIRLAIALSVLAALVLTWGLFRKPIQRTFAEQLLLRSNIPREDLFEELAKQRQDPLAFLHACWETGKVGQRRLVATFLKNSAATDATWLVDSTPLLLECAGDADASVREVGLAALAQLHSPSLFQAAAGQLDDIDPQVRRLGVEYLRNVQPARAMPLLVQSLDDPDLLNAVAAEAALRRFSGVDFGVRASLALAALDGAPGEGTNSANVEAIRTGLKARKEWWREHQKEYVVPDGTKPSAAPPLPQDARPPAPDFTLEDLSGHRVHLTDFRGKVVLLNFWATWCTACLKEIPDLVALQTTLGDRVKVVGVALDGVPDEEGDVPDGSRGSSASVRERVRRAVKLRRINYLVLPDPKGSVGGQYNGGELPTTVIIDAEGKVRRRFIGERNLAIFERMVAAASHPATQPVAANAAPGK